MDARMALAAARVEIADLKERLTRLERKGDAQTMLTLSTLLAACGTLAVMVLHR